MLEYFTVRCDCRCGNACRGATPIASTREAARHDAQQRGWSQERRNGRLIDMCSACRDNHRHRPHAPWEPR